MLLRCRYNVNKMKTSRPEVLLITNNNKLLDRFHSFSAFKTTVIYMKLAQESTSISGNTWDVAAY